MFSKSIGQAPKKARNLPPEWKQDAASLSVVIPIYNEFENIMPLYSELAAALETIGRPYEIVFVDDGSGDGSYELLYDLCQRYPHIKVIRFNRNYGQSAALRAGFEAVCGEYVVTMDGDIQNDPADIKRLLDKISEGYDAVCGWRAYRKDSFGKKLFSKISNTLRAALVGENIHDSGCTLRAYKKECVKNLDIMGEMHRFIPAMLRFYGYSIGEIKVNHRGRTRGKSKYGWTRLIKGFSDLMAVVFWNKFAMRPMHLFGTAGLLIGAIGLISLFAMIVDKLLFRAPLSDRPLFILSVLATIVGIQFIALGIVADVALKIYYNQKNIKNYRIASIIEPR